MKLQIPLNLVESNEVEQLKESWIEKDKPNMNIVVILRIVKFEEDKASMSKTILSKMLHGLVILLDKECQNVDEKEEIKDKFI